MQREPASAMTGIIPPLEHSFRRCSSAAWPVSPLPLCRRPSHGLVWRRIAKSMVIQVVVPEQGDFVFTFSFLPRYLL